jgi:hypothetical protein
VRQVAERLVGLGVVDHRAHRHDDLEVGTALAAAVGAAARLAVRRLEGAPVAEVGQRVESLVRDEVDAAAVAAVTAVRAPERDELLATEAHHAAPAVAGLDLDRGFVDELHGGRTDDLRIADSEERSGPGKAKAPGMPGPSPARGGNPGQFVRRGRRTRACAAPRPCDGTDRAVGEREQRVVGADADVVAGAVLRAALAHEDVARDHALATELLEAESLALGLAAVLGAAACLFMCHG